MYFTDLTGKDRIFLSNKKLLTEVMFVGKKIKWYRDLSSHPYDGSVQFADYFVDDKNQTYKTGLFSSFNKKLLEATASKPELAQKIEKARTDADVIEILKEYEQ